jgi:hypothetical protein
VDHETTTDKQAGRHSSAIGQATETAVPELAGQPLPIGGILSGRDFATMSMGDLGSRARVLTRLQQGAGNGAAALVAASIGAQRKAHGAGTAETVMRDPDEETVYDVTEEIGPVAPAPRPVEADSLAGFADAISAWDEAGKVQWHPNYSYASTNPRGGPPTVTVSLTVGITLAMPEWTLPEDMGPRTRAEFTRWLAALRTHEQGHIDRVYEHFEGIAERMSRLPYARADRLYETTKANLKTSSDTYDDDTDHGISQGTTLDLSIEEEERAEAEEEEEEAE